MATKIPIPKLGQSEETVVIDNWKVKEGDTVKKGDVIFEVETDKAVLEVESQFEGTILKILVPAGKEVPVMTTGAIIGEAGEAIPADMLEAAPAAPVEEAPVEEPVEETVVPKEYEVVYEANPEGVEEWFLYDHNRGTKQSIADLLAVVRQLQDDEGSAASKLKTYKILL